jgi:hypothetical protein
MILRNNGAKMKPSEPDMEQAECETRIFLRPGSEQGFLD